MAHISLPEGLPGIRGLFSVRPEIVPALCELAETLLRGPSTLSCADRELIGAYVSALNDCYYCQASHGAIAACLLDGDEKTVSEVIRDFEGASISGKLKSLLAIAGRVQRGGKQVLASDIERARQQGASDLEIHDTVLIAASFCMFNRYVDGLATWAPTDPAGYRERAAKVARDGYFSVPVEIGLKSR